jgi:hypothetical protein
MIVGRRCICARAVDVGALIYLEPVINFPAAYAKVNNRLCAVSHTGDDFRQQISFKASLVDRGNMVLTRR